MVHKEEDLYTDPDAGEQLLTLHNVQDEGTARALYLAQYINTPIYVVHVMSKGAAGEIAAAKLRGQRVIGETIASGIAAEEGKIWDPDFKVGMQPITSTPDQWHGTQMQHALCSPARDVMQTDSMWGSPGAECLPPHRVTAAVTGCSSLCDESPHQEQRAPGRAEGSCGGRRPGHHCHRPLPVQLHTEEDGHP